MMGFFYYWLQEFAKATSKLTIIALGVGKHQFPEHVQVFSLGKETGQSRLKYIFNFYRHILRERHNYDQVFVHMNVEYMVLGGLIWKLMGKRVSLWYNHKQVTPMLRIAVALADQVFTVSKEGMRVETSKRLEVGHGIQTERFECLSKSSMEPYTIIYVGRITEVKNLETLIRAAAILKRSWSKPLKVVLYGAPVTAQDLEYEKKLQTIVNSGNLIDNVVFAGNTPYEQIPQAYCAASVSVNLSPTGGTDKTVLESMCAGIPVLVSNAAFTPYLGRYAHDLLFSQGDAEDLAKKIQILLERSDLSEVGNALKRQTQEKAGLNALIRKLVSSMEHVRN